MDQSKEEKSLSRESSIKISQESIAGETFWNMLQETKGIIIPIYVKNIFALNNLDNPLSFQCITDETFVELEEFARASMKDLLNRKTNFEDYFGRYHRMPDKFRFLIGDRFLMKKLVAYVKSKPDEYWKMRATLPFSTVYTKVPDNMEELEMMSTAEMTVDKRPLRVRERHELARLVRGSMSRDLKNHPDYLALMEKINVKVTIRPEFDKQKKIEQNLVTGFIKCMICPSNVIIRKYVVPGNNRNPRWVISNFRRHIKSHLKNPGKVLNKMEDYDFEYLDEDDGDFESKEEINVLENGDDDQPEEDQNEVSYTVTW